MKIRFFDQSLAISHLFSDTENAGLNNKIKRDLDKYYNLIIIVLSYRQVKTKSNRASGSPDLSSPLNSWMIKETPMRSELS